MLHEYQKTYMDLNEQKPVQDNNVKSIIGAIVLFTLYAIVSTMDYQDCLRGATSC